MSASLTALQQPGILSVESEQRKAITSAPTLRLLTISDLKAVSRVHEKAFPTSVITRLGQPAVIRYYRWHMGPVHDCIPAGVFDGDALLGFVFGGVFHRSPMGYIEKNIVFLAWQMLVHPKILLDPLFKDRIQYSWQAWTRRWTQKTKIQPPQTRKRSYSILSIAVDPESQGKGIGRILMDYSECEAREKDFERMILVVHVDNTQAIRFYEGLGWVKKRKENWTGCMVKDF